jgi:uncharacterized tellurite resistance protein B-like protein
MDRTELRRWHNMVVAAFSDSELSPGDQEYLNRMRGELGISEEEAREIGERARNGRLELSGKILEQREILKDVICISLADGNVSAEEKRIIDTVARHLGMTEQELEALIDVCRNWKNEAGER